MAAIHADSKRAKAGKGNRGTKGRFKAGPDSDSTNDVVFGQQPQARMRGARKAARLEAVLGKAAPSRFPAQEAKTCRKAFVFKVLRCEEQIFWGPRKLVGRPRIGDIIPPDTDIGIPMPPGDGFLLDGFVYVSVYQPSGPPNNEPPHAPLLCPRKKPPSNNQAALVVADGSPSGG